MSAPPSAIRHGVRWDKLGIWPEIGIALWETGKLVTNGKPQSEGAATALESHSGSSRDITEGNGDRIDILRLLLPWIKSSDGVVARAQKKGVMDT
jgi:hypothetical protein